MFCCLQDVKHLDDLPADVLARFFELLADAQERRPAVWRLPSRALAEILRMDVDKTLDDPACEPEPQAALDQSRSRRRDFLR